MVAQRRVLPGSLRIRPCEQEHLIVGVKRRRSAETFAAVSVKVMRSEAYRTLRSTYKAVLLALAAQYRGFNNGDLALTRLMARNLGVTSEQARSHGLRELSRRGLIEKTYQGGMRPLGPTLWALTWQRVNYRDGKQLKRPETAPNTWRHFGGNQEYDS